MFSFNYFPGVESIGRPGKFKLEFSLGIDK